MNIDDKIHHKIAHYTVCTYTLSYFKLIGFHVHTFPVRSPSPSHLLLTLYGSFYRDSLYIQYIQYCRPPSSSHHAHHHFITVALRECILPSQSVYFISLSLSKTLFIAPCLPSSVQTVWLHWAICACVTRCIWMLSRHCPSPSGLTPITDVHVVSLALSGRISKSCLTSSSRTPWSLVSSPWCPSRGPLGPLVRRFDHLLFKMLTNSVKHPSQVARASADIFESLFRAFSSTNVTPFTSNTFRWRKKSEQIS